MNGNGVVGCYRFRVLADGQCLFKLVESTLRIESTTLEKPPAI